MFTQIKKKRNKLLKKLQKQQKQQANNRLHHQNKQHHRSLETPKQTEVVTAVEKKPELATAHAASVPAEDTKESSEAKSASNILEKFKNIKFKKPSSAAFFNKKDSAPKTSLPEKKSNIRKKFAEFL